VIQRSGWMAEVQRVRGLAGVVTLALLLAACAGAVPQPRGSDRARAPQRPGARPHVPGTRVATARPPAQRPTIQPNRGDPGVNRAPAGLDDAIFQLWRSFPGRTGIAVQRIDGTWSLNRRGDEYFPQQSVSKTWVAMTILDRIDAGRATLTDMVRIGPEDLTLFHQPLAERVAAEGSVTLSVAQLLSIAITQSDNSANEALLRHAGGPDVVRAFLDRQRLGRIRFGPGERLLQSRIAGLEWRQDYSRGRAFQTARAAVPDSVRRAAMTRYLADPEDGASPSAIVDALARLARGELLSSSSTALFLDTLSRTQSGPRRLRAGVPPGWQVAHKTGTGQEFDGVATGYNDIAILTAPDGTRYAVAVMLGSTTASVPQRMELMQAISRTVASYHGM
jgi:beta-lactamase class A